MAVVLVQYRPVAVVLVQYRPVAVVLVQYRPAAVVLVQYRPAGVVLVKYRPVVVVIVQYRPVVVVLVQYRLVFVLWVQYSSSSTRTVQTSGRSFSSEAGLWSQSQKQTSGFSLSTKNPKQTCRKLTKKVCYATLLYRVGLSAIQHLVTETFVIDHKEKKSLFKNKQFCD